VFIGASTKIVDRTTGEMHQGRVPAMPWSCPALCPGRHCRTGARDRASPAR
jgi:hypothetical protein